MALDRIEIVDTPSGFAKNAVVRPVLKSGDKVTGVDSMVDLVAEVRNDFPSSYIVLPKDAVHWDDREKIFDINNDVQTAGWHIHTGYHTVNVGRGSETPTEIAADIGTALRSILATIEHASPQFKALYDLFGLQRKIVFSWMHENGACHVAESVWGHVHSIRGKIEKLLDGDFDEASFVDIQEAFDHYKVFMSVIGDFGIEMLRFSQYLVPPSHRMQLSPKELGAYVIPECAPHGRSLLDVPPLRNKNELNGGFLISSNTGRQRKVFGEA